MNNSEKDILFSMNGIEIYREYPDDEEEFVSFMGLHSLATKGENAIVSIDDILHLIDMIKEGVPSFTELGTDMETNFILAAICSFLNKNDNVECMYCLYGVYNAMSPDEKSNWEQVANYYVKIKCEEW